MIDTGFLATLVVVVLGLQLSARWSPPTLIDRSALGELWVGPVLLGLVVARLAFVAFDGPSSLRNVRELLVFRSGLEFWAGATTGVAVVAWKSRSLQPGVVAVLAASMPFALFGVALYEGSCVVRDGCFGPPSRVGLIPPGLDRRLLPIGIVVGVTLLVVGAALKRLWTMSASLTVVIGGFALAATRAFASRRLPAIGPSRIQFESDLAAAAFGVALAALSIRWIRNERRRNTIVNARPTARGDTDPQR